MGSVTVIGNPTSELVIEKILNMITKGELKIGDRLPPADKLTEIFGVGRSSIKEALRALSVLGYLKILKVQIALQAAMRMIGASVPPLNGSS